MIYYTTILGTEIAVHFSANVTYRGRGQTGPDYYCAGEPAEPMEYELSIDGVESAMTGKPLALRGRRMERLLDEMRESGTVYEMVEEDR